MVHARSKFRGRLNFTSKPAWDCAVVICSHLAARCALRLRCAADLCPTCCRSALGSSLGTAWRLCICADAATRHHKAHPLSRPVYGFARCVRSFLVCGCGRARERDVTLVVSLEPRLAARSALCAWPEMLLRVPSVVTLLAAHATAASPAVHRHQRRQTALAGLEAYPGGLSPVFEADLEVAFGRSAPPDDTKASSDASCRAFATAKCTELRGTLRVFGVGCVRSSTRKS